MSSHNSIVLSGAPAGRFLEGIISGTPKPGTAMQIVAATEPVGGKYTWEVYTRADGNRYLMAILLEAWWLGRSITDAYVTGERCRMYCPIPGDELQVLLQNQAGTGDAFAIGDLLMADSGTGKFLATSSPESEPFIVMETLAAITADTLCHVMATGN
jgi:hypothetical protein